MTIKELIDLLLQIEPKTAEIISEGCDCYGKITGAVTLDDGKVLLTRKN